MSYGEMNVAVEGLARVFWHSIMIITAIMGTILMPFMSDSALAQTPAAASAKPVKLVVLGDSLTAGYGLPANAAFPARLQQALRGKSLDVEIVNAGVSGDTTSGGRDRLDWSVPPDTAAVIVELGANDALRGLDPKVSRAALDEILTKLKARNIAVLLCGMLAPPNYGADYAQAFNSLYPELAKKHGVPLYPFFLDGVAGKADLNLPDGMHPTAAGVDVIVGRILPTVETWLRDLGTQQSAARP